jgi:hypothetical protein
MPDEAIRLSQILKFFNIIVRVSGEGIEVFLNLKQVCERKENMNSHNTLSASQLLERVEGNWLAGGALTANVWGTQGILWFQILGWQVKGGAEGGVEEGVLREVGEVAKRAVVGQVKGVTG